MRRLGLLILGLALLPASVQAQQVRGRVLDRLTDAGVPDAAVALVDTMGVIHGRVLTDSLGWYALPLPSNPQAAFHLVVDALGYESGESLLLQARGADDRRLDLMLKPEPVELRPVVVTTDRVENWLRLEMGVHPNSLGGKVVAGPGLDSLTVPGRDIVDVIRYINLPGSYVYRRATGLCVVTRGAGCAAVRLNGMPIAREALEAIDPSELGAVVFLRDTEAVDAFRRPGQVAGRGVLSLYTRSFLPAYMGLR